MNRVHALLAQLTLSSQGHNKTQLSDVFGLVIDHVVKNLGLYHIASLAGTCRSLRVLTTDELLLSYLLTLVGGKNAKDTRSFFLLPRYVSLQNISQSRYSQSEAFQGAMQRYGGLEKFRHAVVKRREQNAKRIERALIRAVIMRANADRRRQLVINALAVVELPQVFGQIEVHTIRFIHILPQTTPENEELQLELLVERLCWRYYLRTYTDFSDRVSQRIEVTGWYPGLTREIADEYDLPDSWPWLE
jgi:hypothetical protein